MKRLNKTVTAVAIAALSLTSLSALAHPHNGFHDHAAHRLESLQLTPTQKTKIRSIEQQYNVRPSREEMLQDWKQWSEQRNTLLKNKNFDDNKARHLIEQQQEKHAQMQLQNLKKEHDIFQVLTPKQQEQWLQQRDRRAHKFMSHFGKHHTQQTPDNN